MVARGKRRIKERGATSGAGAGLGGRSAGWPGPAGLFLTRNVSGDTARVTIAARFAFLPKP